MNHSCAPNAEVEFKGTEVVLKSLKEIEVDEEVTFDYLGGRFGTEGRKRRQLLEEMWGFKCNCEVCKRAKGRGKGGLGGGRKMLQLKKFK